MKCEIVCCILVLILAAVVADTPEDSTDKINQEEEEYEDIAVAESQDIAHRQLYQNSDQPFDYPRTRPRGRKRRRRLRKRPRSTTPSFIDDYSPEKTVKEEDPPTEEEVVYQRRRVPKRRRRPMRRKPEYDPENPEPESPSEPVEEKPQEEYHRPRNTMRRRRKNGRKRIRVTTELSSEHNNTNEEMFGEATTQPSEVVMQLNSDTLEQKESSEISGQTYFDVTTASIPSTGFTPKEITEINHELESISGRMKNSDGNHHSDSGTEGLLHSLREVSTTQQPREDYEITSSTKDYSWISRIDPLTATNTSTEESSSKEIKLNYRGGSSDEIRSEPPKNIKNLDKIIENRKNLFSKSNRLPPTSAIIRSKLRSAKNRNVTNAQESLTNNIIPTIHEHLEKEESPCDSIECALNKTTLSNNIIPSALLPSGFPTMPEILTTADIIEKMSKTSKENHEKLIVTGKSKAIQHSENGIIIITPSTLIRHSKSEDNLFQADEGKVESLDYTKQETNSNSSLLEQAQDTEDTENDKGESTAELISSTVKEIKFTNFDYGEKSLTPDIEIDTPYTPEILTLDGVDVSNINDEILELIMDEMGKARVKRILELRNMTLSELIAHRERGAGHFSEFTNKDSIISESEHNNTTTLTQNEDLFTKHDSMDEEKTETMIVEKAKQFMGKFKKSDETFSNAMRVAKEEKESFEQKVKVEGTVIPVPILEPTHTSTIEFPEESVLGDFPKYMYDISGKRSKPNQPNLNDKPSLFRDSINKPKDITQSNDKREPKVFESMPRFSSETSFTDDLQIYPYPDWRIIASKPSTEKPIGFPGISREIMLVATSTSKSVSKHANLEDVVLLNEGEEARPLRNHILGGKINIESEDAMDEDYPEPKKIPTSVKSAIAASGALLGLAIFGFLAVLVSCKIRQRRARLRARRDILCEHLAADFRSSQRSHTPVLRKSPFNNNIHSNTASNRNYYLWRTLRKTFQYE